MKTEITMKKAEPVKWTNLDLSDSSCGNPQEMNQNISVGVDALDLSDL